MIKTKELKNNMIVKTRNGDYKLIVDLDENNFGCVGIYNNSTWCHINDEWFNDDLTSRYESDNELDIMEVYEPNSIYSVGRIINNSGDNFESILNCYYTKIYDRKSFETSLKDNKVDFDTFITLLNKWNALTSLERTEYINKK